jgi:hypothetical protein
MRFCVFVSLSLCLIACACTVGCSTAPCADFLDFFFPGGYPGDGKGAGGGVCIQQGGPAGGVLGAPPPNAVGVPLPPPGPVGPPGVADLPPPAPLTDTPLRPGPW